MRTHLRVRRNGELLQPVVIQRLEAGREQVDGTNLLKHGTRTVECDLLQFLGQSGSSGPTKGFLAYAAPFGQRLRQVQQFRESGRRVLR